MAAEALSMSATSDDAMIRNNPELIKVDVWCRGNALVLINAVALR